MKPEVTESAIDGILARLLIQSNSAVRACLAAAAPSSGRVDFDRAIVRAQVPHLGTYGTADLSLGLWSMSQRAALILIENKIDTCNKSANIRT